MTIRKKHATIATVLILLILAVFVLLVVFQEEEQAPQLVTTPALTATTADPHVRVEGDTSKEKQEAARAQLLEHFTETETGG